MRATHKKGSAATFCEISAGGRKGDFSYEEMCTHTHTHADIYVHACVFVCVCFDLCISNKNYSNEGADMRGAQKRWNKAEL